MVKAITNPPAMSPRIYISNAPDIGLMYIALGCTHDIATRRMLTTTSVSTIKLDQIRDCVPRGLKRLEVVLGPQTDNNEEIALVLVLDNMVSFLPDLEAVSITAYSSVWTQCRQQLVNAHTLLCPKRTIRVLFPQDSDSNQYSEVVVTRQFTKGPPRETSYVDFPLVAILNDHSTGRLLQLPNLSTMKVQENSTPISATNTNVASRIIELFITCRSLQEATVSLGLEDCIVPLLVALAALPLFHGLKFTDPLFNSVISSTVVTRILCEGLNGFHHLRYLSLPAKYISAELRSCLGGLEDLRVLTIVTKYSSLPAQLPPVGNACFPALHRLKIEGPLCSYAGVIRAIIHADNLCRALYLKVPKLDNMSELHNAFRFISSSFPHLKDLTFDIKEVDEQIKFNYFDLTPLAAFLALEELRIRHSDRLFFQDEDIGVLLKACRQLIHVSLNPRPGVKSHLDDSRNPNLLNAEPSLECLSSIAQDGRKLKYFGVYLNSYGRLCAGQETRVLQTLELRGRFLDPLETDHRVTKWVYDTFPNAHIKW